MPDLFYGAWWGGAYLLIVLLALAMFAALEPDPYEELGPPSLEGAGDPNHATNDPVGGN